MEVAEKHQEFLYICGFFNVFNDYLLKLNRDIPIPTVYGLKLYMEGLEDDMEANVSDEEFWHLICGLLVNYHKKNKTIGFTRTVPTLNQSARQRKTWLIEFCKNEELFDLMEWFADKNFDEMPLKMKLEFVHNLLEAQLDIDDPVIEKDLEVYKPKSLRLQPFGKDNKANVYYKFEKAYSDGSSMLVKEAIDPNENPLCVLFKPRRKNQELQKLIQSLDKNLLSAHCNHNESCSYNEEKHFIRKCSYCGLEWHSSCLIDPFLHGDEEEWEWLCPDCNHEDLIIALKQNILC